MKYSEMLAKNQLSNENFTFPHECRNVEIAIGIDETTIQWIGDTIFKFI